MVLMENQGKYRNYSTRDYVYETLKENIVKMILKPGQSISEKEMADVLQVSRTPIREAFVRLAQEELLEVYPQRGTFVSLINLDHVEEVRFIREILEKASARHAAENKDNVNFSELKENLQLQRFYIAEKNYEKFFELDEQFHHLISLGANKPRIWTVLQNFNAHLNRIRLLSLSTSYKWDHLLDQHLEIVEAIELGDADHAERAMQQHVTKLRFELDDLKERYPDYFI